MTAATGRAETLWPIVPNYSDDRNPSGNILSKQNLKWKLMLPMISFKVVRRFSGPSVKSKPHKTKHCKKQTLFKPNCEKTKYCKKQTLMKKQTYICVIGLSNNSQDQRLFNHCNH